MLLKHKAAFLCQQTGGQFCHGIGCNISPKRPPISPYLNNKILDIQIEFEGFLGDRYIKQIYGLPRKGV
jgi:hypothetical protein